MGPMQQGLSSAVASGSAMGGGKGGPAPGDVHTLLNIFAQGLSKVGKEATQLFSGEFLGGGGAGLGGFKDTGIFSKLFDVVAVGADAKSAFAAWTDSNSGGGASGGGGGNNNGGGSNIPFPTVANAADGAKQNGMVYYGTMQRGATVSPSATPDVGMGGKSMGM